MCRRYRNRFAEPEAVEFARGNCSIQTFRLVYGQPGVFRVTAGELGDMLVGRSQAASAINEYDRDIGLLQRTHRLRHHALIDSDFAAGNTAGIDHEIGDRSELAETVLAIARQPRVVCDQCVARACQAIEECRLTNIRPADDCDNRKHDI